MATAVMEPLTRNETARKTRRDGVGMEREAAEFIKPNASLTSLERLEIYNRQYWFRLYSSFEDDFPGLLAVLGRKKFERVMRAYLDACPSASYTLRDLGSRLPSFLAEHEELTAPNSRLGQDVVRTEWAHIEAYDAATISPPTPELFTSITDETALRLQPCIRLLDLSYPVDELLIAVRQDAGSSDTSSNNATATRRVPAVRRVAQLAPSPIWLAVYRQEFTVYYKRLEPEEYRMLTAIQSGASLGEVFATAFSDATMDETAQAAFLQEAFQQWAILGWLCAPNQSDKQRTQAGESK
ncbi:MAG: putative DNA-binding domain-containing protein [Candidatus Korobacteraceae bacterium]